MGREMSTVMRRLDESSSWKIHVLGLVSRRVQICDVGCEGLLTLRGRDVEKILDE